MNNPYSNNNELLIKYYDLDTEECLMVQQSSIASVIIQALTICNYVRLLDTDYVVIETRMTVSLDPMDKNVFEVWIENTNKFDVGEESEEEE